jgi:hypothetical protein
MRRAACAAGAAECLLAGKQLPAGTCTVVKVKPEENISSYFNICI